MTVALAWERCVRTRAVAAECRACVDACPAGALDLGGPRGSVTVDPGACIDCGLCQAACPTESFSGAVDVAAFVAAAGPALACTPAFCLAALAVEDLVTLAVRHGTLRVDAAGCAQCRTAPKGHAALTARLEQARDFLVAAGLTARTAVTPGARPAPPAPAPVEGPARAAESVAEGRRAFLRRFVPPAVQEAAAPPPPPRRTVDFASLDAALLRAREVPARRQRLLAALAAAPREGAPRRLERDAVAFSSSKALDLRTCTACLQCVTTCPTAALTVPRLRDELRFEAARCVRCGTCHDVCEPDALSLARSFDTGAFLAAEVQALGRFPVKACGECGALFRYTGGDAVCPRCLAQDAEARELSFGPRGSS